MRILVVDDDAKLRGAVRAMLVGTGYEIAEACGGVEAVEVVRRSGADLILCDVFMPEGGGLDFLRRLRSDRSPFRVVAMSGGGDFHGSIDILPMASFLGAAGVLYKPFTQEELRAAISGALHLAPAC